MNDARGIMMAGRAIAVTMALGIALSGCTGASTGDSTAPTSSATPEAPAQAVDVDVAADLSAPPVSGTGPTAPFPGVDFPIPEGARSLELDLVCASDARITVEVGDSMATGQAVLEGTCGAAAQTMVWPISEKTSPTLNVWAPEGVAWTATPRFSTAEFVTDETIAAECAAFGDVYSALMNADQEYRHYQAFGLDEWTSRVDAAAADLAALANSSTSTMAPGFAQLLATLQSPDRVAGEVSIINPNDLLGDACAVNHTPLVLNAEFGG
nr:hypothetical protein [Microbacterium hydrocarbonoxydans]